jgi:hypothetical protein
MSTSSQPIYNVLQQYYACSISGELGSRHVSERVAVIVIFDDNSIMVKHYTDVELFKTNHDNEVEDEDKDDGNAMNLFENIAKHIVEVKKVKYQHSGESVRVGSCWKTSENGRKVEAVIR